MNPTTPAVIVGMGELGGSFARGLLRIGHPVVPVLRRTAIADVAAEYPEPVLTLVTVGEADLDNTLANLPAEWKSNTVLVQNELLPRSWMPHDITDPTVAVVWFEKKPGRSELSIIPTPIAGPGADLLTRALRTIDVPAFVVESQDELLYELVRKNMYILTVNIGGLTTRGSVADLWYNNRKLAEDVAADVLKVQAWLTGAELDSDALMTGMVEAIDGDPEHGSTGRSAPARLARAISHADEAGLEVPKLREIAASLE
ncbi:MAG: hypothetical protein QNL12_16100 [Acidimicrobiia bacterium]|nr:hypothetical protein [Acidimicrobiia bacterium]MDX2468835.1 hypothetical protein [Acidimicrobiia bacterium]